MQPADVAMLLQQEFVEVLPSTIGDVEQDTGIADELLLARTADIHGATRYMIRGRHTTSELVHCRRAIARVHDNSFDILRGVIILAWLQTVERVIAVA